MADPEAPADPNFTAEMESLATPPMDPLYFSAHGSIPDDDIGFSLNNCADIHLDFGELGHLYLPSESEKFLIPDSGSPLGNFGDLSPESANSEILGDCGSAEVDTYLKSWTPESGCCDRPDSSQGSGVSEAMNVSSPDSGHTVVEQKIEVEEIEKPRVSKRKKENDDSSISKCRRSSLAMVDAPVGGEDEKRRARLTRNRESAQLSRQRKKHYVEELEDKVRNMHSTISDLNNKVAYFMAENAGLRQQLSAGSAAQMHPPPPMYPPMGPMPYPWVPYPPYMVKRSQVPLVPIPRLKSQQPAPAPKVKKSENKKAEGKTKKVASVSLLGILFFVLLFGGLVPMVNVKYGGIRDGMSNVSGFVSDGFYNSHRGRVLQVSSHLNLSEERRGIGYKREKMADRGGGSEDKNESTGRNGHPENVSEPLAAALYVPRNDKLVKIDGNLIIHSVLASEKAMASKEASEVKSKRGTGLAVPRDFSPALAITEAIAEKQSHVYRNPAKRQRALSSGSADALKKHFQSSAADGKMQQWFHEGLAGPMLSSGMCTEVFQFDTSPKPGAIIPASSAAKDSVEQNQNYTQLNKGRNRRTLHGLQVPRARSNLNVSGHTKNSQKENFQGNKTSSSVVVSVLVDPREAGDGEADKVVPPRSLSRIFVVVLMDSVKYVTYSCVLPRSGTHVVTT